MANDRKIDALTPNLLVKYRETVKLAAEKGVREALAVHKAAGNPVAVSRNGNVVLLAPDEVASGTNPLDAIWNNDQDDVYAKLLR